MWGGGGVGGGWAGGGRGRAIKIVMDNVATGLENSARAHGKTWF